MLFSRETPLVPSPVNPNSFPGDPPGVPCYAVMSAETRHHHYQFGYCHQESWAKNMPEHIATTRWDAPRTDWYLNLPEDHGAWRRRSCISLVVCIICVGQGYIKRSQLRQPQDLLSWKCCTPEFSFLDTPYLNQV